MRAIALNLTTGEHGLPLMGTGDWNDGMNLVGSGGQGRERLARLVPRCRCSGRLPTSPSRAAKPTAPRPIASTRRQLEAALEQAWDGDWYSRAYFDDGTPLGSKENTECRIDAIAQSWSVLAHGPNQEHARRAMQSVNEHLVRDSDRIVLLLTPPFDKMTPSPGYIQGYVPGVRENGGQYTHAALWTVLAFAELGDGNRAAELFSMINPITHTRDAAALEHVSRRTLRRRRRSLLAAATRRTRRMDLVHRVRWLDVSGGRRIDPRPQAPRRRTAHRPVHSERRGRATRWSSKAAAPSIASSSRIRRA